LAKAVEYIYSFYMCIRWINEDLT